MATATAAFTPHWVEHPLMKPQGPGSWLFYVVSCIDRRHRPLAVVRRPLATIGTEANPGRDLVVAALRIVTILSDPANRVAIEAERAIATDFYQDAAHASLPVVDLPDKGGGWPSCGVTHAGEFIVSKLAAHWGLREFPFISTCLLLGVSFGSFGSRCEPWPLGTVYRDHHVGCGMAVIDITDLDNVCYGIVAFMTRILIWVVTDVEWLDNGPAGDPVPTVEEHRPRRPLSASKYMAKFGYSDAEEVSKLQQISLIDAATMDVVWPPSSLDLEGIALPVRASRPLDPKSIILPVRAHHPPRSHSDQAVAALIDSTLEADSFEMSVFDEYRTATPHFQELLQQLLRERSARLGHLRSARQLIGLAVGGKAHLGLERLEGLSAEAIGAALETEELKDLASISLCVDTIRSTPAQILDALSRAPSLRDLCFLQAATRVDDQPSTALFVELSKRPQLLRGKVTITGAYSASLSKRFWLPTVNYQPPFEVFPIQHMLVRDQITPTAPIMFHPFHYYFGDGLLRPEAFAAGFLNWLRSTDELLFSFAAGPPTLEDMSRAEVSPIPAENFTIPVYPFTRDENAVLQPKCWPKMRDLVPGSWTVLVSREKFWNREMASHNTRTGGWAPIEARLVKYAFVRPRVRIIVEEPLAVLGPDELEVGGLKEFLRATAPAVDSALVDQRLTQVAEYMAGLPQARLGPGLEWLSVLTHDDACALLGDFLSHGVQGKENLRRAMREKPEERHWYPELFDEQDMQAAASA